MNSIRMDNEWLRWGDKATDFVGFFAPIKSAEFSHDGMIYVECKYGKYRVDPVTQKVATVEGTEYDTLVEVAKYGMGYKFWESEKE